MGVDTVKLTADIDRVLTRCFVAAAPELAAAGRSGQMPRVGGFEAFGVDAVWTQSGSRFLLASQQ